MAGCRSCMNDCWTIVANFLDIPERGRLYTAVSIHKSWENLGVYYLHTTGSRDLVQKMKQQHWSFLKKYCYLGKQLCLPCGIATPCWSPWCCPQQLKCTSRGVSVVFDTHYDEHHCRFVLWVRTMAQRKNSLKLVTNLVACTRWHSEYTLPIRGGNSIPVMQVLNKPFRVKLQIHRVYYKIVNNGYPRLLIQHFEFR